MRIIKQFIWVLCLCSVAACTHENLSECDTPNVGLTFSNAFAPLSKAPLADEVHSLDVFIFDHNGLCLLHKRDDTGPFSSNYVMLLRLLPDTYTCVAWANLHAKNYLLSGDAAQAPFEVGRSYQKESMLHLQDQKGIVSTDLANLFHGVTTGLRVEYNAPDIYRRDIPMIKDVNTINIKLEYVGSVIQGGELKVELDGRNAHMYFDNSLNTTLPGVIYRPYIATAGTDFVAEVLRLRTELPLIMRIINPLTGVTVLSEDLTQLILKTGLVKTNDDFDRLDTYNIVISFGVDVEATITINGWEVKDPESDLE
ncbi:MAG: FimB/Mfa2 family fimbrial subunit [Mucinivorans sp.]